MVPFSPVQSSHGDAISGYHLAAMNGFRFFVAAVVLWVAGCTSLNQRLNDPALPPESRQKNHTRAALAAEPSSPVAGAADREQHIRPSTTRSTTTPGSVDPNNDGYFVGIAISGGGSRSANFSAACMFQLRRLGLLQRADYLSSVSGGSLTAAYYCLSNDEEWNTANVQRKLTHHFATDMILTVSMPWNWLPLTFTDWDRSDVMASSFQKVLFSRSGKPLTFADLRPDRPHLLINATDLQSGKPFIFCDEAFDQINSDLGTYPIAHAVAASSAVPVLLHQVTLRDFNTIFKQYRHLVDGGVVDNLGVKTLVETYRAQVKASNGTAYPRGAVFILLDARTQYDARVSSRGDTSWLESLQFGAGLSSTVLLNRASSATLDEMILDSAPDHIDAATLRKERDDLINGGYVRLQTAQGRPVYVLHLALSRVNDIADLPFVGFTESVNNISTYFNIDPAEAAQLYQAAELLMEKRFRQPLREIADELNGTPAPANGK
jgi:predicted acylesterase/phospholipase RssA